jgi:3-hydroxymyristoyl/3-hydroxydecanoyl-(acyl carrier protein) dehydratase
VAVPAVPAPALPATPGPTPGPGPGPAGTGSALSAWAAARIGAALAAAHSSALLAETALQERELARYRASTGVGAAVPAAATPTGAYQLGAYQVVGTRLVPVELLPPAPATRRVSREAAFKPLAATAVTDLDRAALERLAAGDVAGVFGPAYDQEGVNPRVRLADGEPLLLAAVAGLDPRAGAAGLGALTAATAGPIGDGATLVTAALQAARLLALRLGLHLCLADAGFARLGPTGPDESAELEITGPLAGPLTLRAQVGAADLVPRPWLRLDVEALGPDGAVAARLRGLHVGLAEAPGAPVGAGPGGVPATWLGRKNRFGDRAVLSEFHMAHFCRGDQGLTLGPEFAHYTGRKATRLPDGGLLLVDRVMTVDATRGVLAGGATHVTEYDAHADSWYFADTANASMPNCVYMETSLQAALMIGYWVGPTLGDPDAVVSLRNLGGTATVLREVDLRGATIRQHSELLSTTIMPGSSLQNFGYTLSVDGEPFYEGETLFGYFSDGALANQTGLDGGKPAPTWLESQPTPPATRTIDVAARRADPAAPLCSRETLALLDTLTVVDGGGRHGAGYLFSRREIDQSDWYFARHFVYDPVIPGSLGVESVVQALQEWMLDAGLADELAREGRGAPGFILPVGKPFSWKYRGQFLPTDGSCTLEAHIRGVERRPGRVRVSADASMWKPGLRIYEMTDLTVELRAEGAPPWS